MKLDDAMALMSPLERTAIEALRAAIRQAAAAGVRVNALVDTEACELELDQAAGTWHTTQAGTPTIKLPLMTCNATLNRR